MIYFDYIQEEDVFGFFQEGDTRITENAVELTEEQHRQLLEENSQGRDIVLYNGEVFTALPNQYIRNGNVFVLNPNYEQEQAEKQKEVKKQELLEQIDELDKKRIRAICEPSEKEPGLTWLEYYNNQIKELRKEINNL